MKPETTASPSLERKDFWVSLMLGVGALLSRLPFQPRLLNSYDAVNYALALSHFDVRLHRTQPPGYPLYIVLVRALRLILPDDRLALVWFSAIFSGLAAIAIYLTGRELLGRRAGIFAALITVTAPAIWYQGEIAAPYSADLFFSALSCWLCYRARLTRRGGVALLAALAIGVAGGLRPQNFFYLLPLLLLGLWGGSWKTSVAALAIAAGSFIALFSPAVFWSGGIEGYLGAVFSMTGSNIAEHQNLYHAWRFLGYFLVTSKMTLVTVGEWNWPLVFLGIIALFQQSSNERHLQAAFLALWVLPAWTVFCLLYPGNPGTILVFITPFFLLAGLGIETLLRTNWRRIGWALTGGILLWQALSFTLLPDDTFGPSYRRLDNYHTIRWMDRYLQTKFELIRQFPSEGTLVYAYNLRYMQYYLPEYHTSAIPVFDPKVPTHPKSVTTAFEGRTSTLVNPSPDILIPPGTRLILFFDLPPETYRGEAARLERFSRDGFDIWCVELPARGSPPAWVQTPEGVFLVE